jgi:hypothetical protein
MGDARGHKAMSHIIQSCSFEGCNEPVFDYITLPDHSGNLAGLCVKHNSSNPLYFNYLTRKYTATRGNGTENMYAPPCPLPEDD